MDETTELASLVAEADNSLRWNDPRWDELGITYRQLDHWTTCGYLNVIGETNPGSGHQRRWPVEEFEVAKRMKNLMDSGFRLGAAARFAREGTTRIRRVVDLIESL